MDDRPDKRPRLTSVTSVAWAPPETTFTWTLENLTDESFTGAAPSDVWRSDEFDSCGLRWRLELFPRVEREGEHVSRFSFQLVSAYSGVDRQLFAEGSELVVRSTTDRTLRSPLHRFKLRTCTARELLRTNSFLPLATLCDPARGYIANGIMTIDAKLRARSFAQLAPLVPRPPRMSAELGAALLGGDLADVIFTAPDGESIPAHAMILGLRSTTLRALLLGPMAQALPSVRSPSVHAVPGGLDSVTFNAVLQFLYTDDEPAADATRMRAPLAAADFLDVPRLREICEAGLHAALAPDNAVAALQLATALSCRFLRDAALRYTAANAVAVMSSPDWSSLSPELAADVMHTMAVGEPPYMAHAQPAAGAGAAGADIRTDDDGRRE